LLHLAYRISPDSRAHLVILLGDLDALAGYAHAFALG
jgi:hypothetical protein